MALTRSSRSETVSKKRCRQSCQGWAARGTGAGGSIRIFRRIALPAKGFLKRESQEPAWRITSGGKPFTAATGTSWPEALSRIANPARSLDRRFAGNLNGADSASYGLRRDQDGLAEIFSIKSGRLAGRLKACCNEDGY